MSTIAILMTASITDFSPPLSATPTSTSPPSYPLVGGGGVEMRKEVDLQPYLTGEVFGELLDLDKFIQYGLTTYTIEWANGADLAPEFLYENRNSCIKTKEEVGAPTSYLKFTLDLF